MHSNALNLTSNNSNNINLTNNVGTSDFTQTDLNNISQFYQNIENNCNYSIANTVSSNNLQNDVYSGIDWIYSFVETIYTYDFRIFYFKYYNFFFDESADYFYNLF